MIKTNLNSKFCGSKDLEYCKASFSMEDDSIIDPNEGDFASDPDDLDENNFLKKFDMID